MAVFDRFKNAINAFTSRDPTNPKMQQEELKTASSTMYYGGIRPDRNYSTSYGKDRSVAEAIINRIAVDVASVDIRHVYTDSNKSYLKDVDSSLNNCLTLEANLDQSWRDFILDIVLSVIEEGNIAVCPIDYDKDIDDYEVVDIYSLRVGKIVEWRPKHVKVRLYDERNGQYKDLLYRKCDVAIMENPFYTVMNRPNGTLKRLIRKLSILDIVDEQTGSGKLNMIIQLPYSVRTEVKKEQAEARKKDIEMQLTENKYGIAYIDSTEKVIQLNRALDNNLLTQIESLIKLLFSQLGMTEEILNGTANQETMLNYFSRTVQPYLNMIADEFKRKFISRTARTQGQTIMYFRDPFALVPVSEIAKIADTMTRNEIMTANEIRQKIGMKPSSDPRADELRNKNLSQSSEAQSMEEWAKNDGDYGEEGDYQNGAE